MRHTEINWTLAIGTIAIAIAYQAIVVAPLALPIDFFFLNTVILIGCTILAFCGSPYPSGPYQSIMTFYAIFFGIIPPLHLSEGIVLWRAGEVVLDFYASASLLSLAALFCFQFSYLASAKRLLRFKRNYTARPRTVSSRRLAVISALAALAIYTVNDFSLRSVFVRGGELKEALPLDQTSALIYQFFVFPIPCMALLIYIVKAKRVDGIYILLVILFVIANPPTGMARFQAAAMYISVFLVMFPNLMKYRFIVPLGMLFGMLLIFPTLEVFRNYRPDQPIIRLSLEFLLQGHFDSFQSLASALAFGDPTWGRALLGTLLFFVPRAIWPGKPIGSGAYIAEQEGFSFSNISMNFIGEGYMNFGVAGSLAFMLVAGATIGQFDRRFWKRTPSPLFTVQYVFLIGLVFFIARGDLLSSFAFTMGIMASSWVVWLFVTIGVRNRTACQLSRPSRYGPSNPGPMIL